jgi:site-specific recombinase XerD
MTFASQLISESVPYEVVRTLLGHVNPESTRHYVEYSIEGLRTCALEIPLPSGLLEKYLSGEEV